MWKPFVPILLSFPILLRQIDAIPLGIIQNVSLVSTGSPITIFNGTCKQCVCQMVQDSTFFALNCFPNENRCEMHPQSAQSATLQLVDEQTSTFYFLSLPTATPAAATYLTDSSTTPSQG